MMFWYGGGWPRGEIEPEEYRRLREASDGSPDRPAGNGSGTGTRR